MGNYVGCCTDRGIKGLFDRFMPSAVGDETAPVSPKRKNVEFSNKQKTIMGKYSMGMNDADKLGEGSFSMVRRATDVESGDVVAVKIYKSSDHATLKQIRRLVSVLKELQLPFEDVPGELWHEQLGRVHKAQLFMWLVDFSKTSDNEAGPDPRDKVNYVVTEMAEFSLLDYIKDFKRRGQHMPSSTVKALAKGVIFATAGLHARGFVHLDLKPENYMVFNGNLKVIDVDGCVRLGAKISIDDSSLSFSPCYCSPEWARFLIGEEDVRFVTANASLDVWSVGMTIAELVHMEAVLKPKYASFLRMGRSSQDAGFLFMEWLSTIHRLPLPKKVEDYDAEVLDLLEKHLLVCSEKRRTTLAQSLSHSALKITEQSSDCPIVDIFRESKEESKRLQSKAVTSRTNQRYRSSQQTGRAHRVVHSGTVWKLHRHADSKDVSQWHKHDMWIAENGSLCYFSIKKNTQTVLLDGHHLSEATVSKYNGSMPIYKGVGPTDQYAFQIEADFEDGDHDIAIFAAETEDTFTAWVDALTQMTTPHAMSMRLGPALAKDLQEFKLLRRNRRIKVDDDGTGHRFEGKLWKLKVDGSAIIEKDWFQRDMWLARDGSLVYHSQREKADLVYYTAADILSAKIEPMEDKESCKSFTFKVQFPDIDGMEIPPGILAADSAKAREGWITALRSLGR